MDFVCVFVSMYLYFLQVLSDMTLILLSVVGNLFVLNSLREKEALLAITQNLVRPKTKTFRGGFFFLIVFGSLSWPNMTKSYLESSFLQVLLNICFANLVSAIFIKSISIIHNGLTQNILFIRVLFSSNTVLLVVIDH